MPESFTPTQRAALLEEAFELMPEFEELDGDYEAVGEDESESIGQRLDEISDRLEEIRKDYLAGLPRVAISRCPFCRKPLVYPIDNLGIDGLWWDSDQPLRPDPEAHCPHFYGLSGALKLGGEPPEIPILVKPGPEVPYVISRLFRTEGLVAVVSSVPVGEHTGFPIAYYADPLPEDVLRPDTWGMGSYEYLSPEGAVQWGEAEDPEIDYDYDLARWIGEGRVQWIAPGDPELALHEGHGNCPYLKLDGRREGLRIQLGEVWTLSDLDAPDTDDLG